VKKVYQADQKIAEIMINAKGEPTWMVTGQVCWARRQLNKRQLTIKKGGGERQREREEVHKNKTTARKKITIKIRQRSWC